MAHGAIINLCLCKFKFKKKKFMQKYAWWKRRSSSKLTERLWNCLYKTFRSQCETNNRGFHSHLFSLLSLWGPHYGYTNATLPVQFNRADVWKLISGNFSRTKWDPESVKKSKYSMDIYLVVKGNWNIDWLSFLEIENPIDNEISPISR